MGYAHLSAQYTERDIYIYMKLRHVINSCKIMFTHVYMRSHGTISGCFDMPWGSPKAVFQPLKILLHQRVELRHILLYNIKSYNIILYYHTFIVAINITITIAITIAIAMTIVITITISIYITSYHITSYHIIISI